jgi:hypothetical protein
MNNESHPFPESEILESWLQLKQLKLSDIEYQDLPKSQKREFKDKNLSSSWEEFHSNRFKPQPAHSKCNIAQG